MEEKKFQMDFAGRPLTIEVGKLAKQSSGAALVRYGGHSGCPILPAERNVRK